MSATHPKQRLPPWMRVSSRGAKARGDVRKLVQRLGLHTVCESAKCPNLCECWQRGAATFMVLGDVCTRNCRFCAVNHGTPAPPDPDEPIRVAQAVAELGLSFIVVTCVTRDDLPDGGAAHIAATVQAIHKMASGTGVEVLPSDFGGRLESVETVMAARPQVYNHNVETVERLTPCIRDQADYRRSLVSLRHAATLAENTDTSTKSGIMLGLGETDEEIKATLRDLRDAHVSILTIGQYLPPSAKHWPLDRYVTPDEFDRWGEIARRDFGFPSVVSGPMVRSSYHAQEAAETAGSPHREGSSPRRHEGEHGHLTG